MRRLAAIFTLAALAGLSACAHPQSKKTANLEPAFYVPATLIVQTPEVGPAGDHAGSPLAFQVLAAADFQQSYFPRGEKFVYGDIPLQQFNAYNVLTYDVQRISGPDTAGYRYTWDVKSGVNVR